MDNTSKTYLERVSGVSNTLRNSSRLFDIIPMDVAGILGTGISELGAASLAALAASVNITAALLDKNPHQAGEELIAGVADTAIAAIPWVEYSMVVGKAFGKNWSARDLGSNFARKAYKKYISARDQHIIKPSNSKTDIPQP